MSEPATADVLVRRILDGTAPPQLKAAAARGALPLPRPVLVRLFVALEDDPDEGVRTDARRSLSELSDEAIAQTLEAPECTPEVLRHFAPTALKHEELAERIVFHPDVPDDALGVLASKGNSSVIELILTNQERLLSSPPLLHVLSVNPAMRADQRGRLVELLDRASRIASAGDAARRDAGGSDEEMTAEQVAQLLEVDVGELYAASEIMGGEEFEQSEVPEIRSAYRKILQMNTAQRAILAMKGGRDERLILVRDSNKLVSLAVLRNGRITEGEIEGIAGMRSVNQDVLRTVGTNREWTKNYAVVAALVRNPRTPPGISTNFVSRLNNHDLKMLSRDKNVPELIRRMSKKTLDTRTQQSAGFRKKH